MAYQVALTQVAFNRNYENVMRFDTREQQQTYFEVDRLFQGAPTLNLIAGDFYNLEISYKIQGNTLKAMESYNYCIIKNTNDNTTKYYYYFITNLRYDSVNQFLISLEMDIFNTYYIDAVFNDSLINRAHLNRYELLLDIDNEPIGVTFNNKPDSLMLIPEISTDLSKYCVNRFPMYKNYFNNTAFDDWINENVEAWVYVFLKRNHQYKFYTADGNPLTLEPPQALFIDEELFDSGAYNPQYYDNYYTYICMPIYKTDKRMYLTCVSGGSEVLAELSTASEQYFKNENNDTSYYIARVISQMPPRNVMPLSSTDYTITNDGNLIIHNKTTGDYPVNAEGIPCLAGQMTSNIGANLKYAVFTPFEVHIASENKDILIASPTTYSCTIENYSQLYRKDFGFSEFLNADFDKKFNPKLYGSNYRSLKFVNSDGTAFEYDLQKMNYNRISALYTEKPQPGVTRTYTRLDTFNTDYGLYTKPTAENLTGLVVSQDCNLCYTNDQLEEYLANNRNAQTQVTARGIEKLTEAVVSGITGMVATGVQSGTFTPLVKGAGNTVNALINMGFSLYQFELSKDNMRNAPDLVKNANGDVIFNTCTTEFNVFVELWQGITPEIDREAERMNMFGYKYNRLGNIKAVDNIRKYFNFVQGVVESMVYVEGDEVKSLPARVLSKFKEVFSNGVRFWNYTGGKFMVYDKENYENWLIPYVEGS